MNIHQVKPWKQWPSGDSRPIAVLPYDPAELSARYGLEYEEGIDDLDRYRLAAIELANGEQAWISKHDGDPNPGTVVHVDARIDAEDAQAMLLEAFGLDRDELLWTTSQPVSGRAGSSS